MFEFGVRLPLAVRASAVFAWRLNASIRVRRGSFGAASRRGPVQTRPGSDFAARARTDPMFVGDETQGVAWGMGTQKDRHLGTAQRQDPLNAVAGRSGIGSNR
jgi:hypothetical protein